MLHTVTRLAAIAIVALLGLAATARAECVSSTPATLATNSDAAGDNSAGAPDLRELFVTLDAECQLNVRPALLPIPILDSQLVQVWFELNGDDTFVVRGKVSGFDKETVLAFPTTQLCGSEAKVVWDEVPTAGEDAHALEHPAPTITVTPASEEHAHGRHGAHQAAAGPVEIGDDFLCTVPVANGTSHKWLPRKKISYAEMIGGSGGGI